MIFFPSEIRQILPVTQSSIYVLKKQKLIQHCKETVAQFFKKKGEKFYKFLHKELYTFSFLFTNHKYFKHIVKFSNIYSNNSQYFKHTVKYSQINIVTIYSEYKRTPMLV